ncbi:MAG: hypothetical protein HKN88_03540 [Gammaproteobacteria bacterium]|nr:hypothetical protein [Gammaproteobacteria bacterium]NNC97127.1 hypothetical protein [Gammaproteobacteria bacterium]NNM12696.1 hypothetical protein [Gammaproteobacteria bacterium]
MSYIPNQEELDLVEQISQGTYPGEQFTHRKHLHLAWLHAHSHEPHQAVLRMCADIQSYVKVLGAADKFNLTVTAVLAAEVVTRVIAQKNLQNFADWLSRHPDLEYHALDLLKGLYTPEQLQSAQAKETMLWPDLAGFSYEVQEILEQAFS